MAKRIAVLLHERDTAKSLRLYQVAELARYWQEDGHRVEMLFGTGRVVPADLLIVHVDLSVVPDAYLEYSRRYPIALNARLKDIRKSAVATNLLRHGDAYDGAAIVKSNYNFGGIPEARLAGQPRPVVDQYRVYARFRDVPAALFAREDLVVQKFEAERDGALYCVRYLAVMGRYRHCIRLRSRSHLVKGDNCLPDVEAIDPHPEILAAREKLGLDYGKMDYVVVDGRAILLDVNKTVGIGMMSDDPKMRKLRRERASALYGYFE